MHWLNSFTLVQMHISDCYITHLLQPGVKIVFKKAGYKADGVKLHLFCFLKGLVNAIGIVSVDTEILRRFFFAPSEPSINFLVMLHY